MIAYPRLTEAQRNLVTGIAITVVTGILSILATLWAVVALVVGTVVLGRWIGGIL